jgi:hypothetical protein
MQRPPGSYAKPIGTVMKGSVLLKPKGLPQRQKHIAPLAPVLSDSTWQVILEFAGWESLLVKKWEDKGGTLTRDIWARTLLGAHLKRTFGLCPSIQSFRVQRIVRATTGRGDLLLCDEEEVVKIASLQVALSSLSKNEPPVSFEQVFRGLCFDFGFDYDDPVVTASLTMLYERTKASKTDWERFFASELRDYQRTLSLLTKRYVLAAIDRISVEDAICLLFDCWKDDDGSFLILQIWRNLTVALRACQEPAELGEGAPEPASQPVEFVAESQSAGSQPEPAVARLQRLMSLRLVYGSYR